MSTVDKVELEALHMQFHSLSTSTNEGGGIEKSTFDRCILDFDIIVNHGPRISRLYTTPCAPCDVLYISAMLIGC